MLVTMLGMSNFVERAKTDAKRTKFWCWDTELIGELYAWEEEAPDAIEAAKSFVVYLWRGIDMYDRRITRVHVRNDLTGVVDVFDVEIVVDVQAKEVVGS